MTAHGGGATSAGSASAFTFGARAHGLICAYRFRPGQPGEPIDEGAAAAFLRSSSDSTDGFVWLHFDLTDASALAWMRANLDLPPDFHSAVAQGSRSTRLEDAQDTLVAVVNDVAYEFAFDPSEIATLWMCTTPRLAVTARSHPLRSIDRVREAVRRGHRFASTTSLLNQLLHQQGDVLTHIVREATLRVDDIEDSLLAGRLSTHRVGLGRLRRVLVRLQRLLAPEPGALFRLLRQPPPWIEPDDLDGLRQSTEEFSLVIRDLSALQERIKLLQEEIAAQVGEQTNRSLFTLTMVTVLALPINITTGFFGMNVGGIPLAEHPHGFLILGCVVVLFTAVAGWMAFRRRD